jgi:dUTP pyrophosphatase
LVQADALSRKWLTYLLSNNVDEILLSNQLFAAAPSLRNCIALVLLTSVDTMVENIPVIEELLLLVDITKGQLPRQATLNSAGLDLFANKASLIPAHNQRLIQLGIKVALLLGTYGQVAPRSGLFLKEIDISARIIDLDFQGELQVVMINHTDQPFKVYAGDMIAQLIVKNIAFSTLISTSSLNNTL